MTQGRQGWAAQDANTPTETREKPHVAPQGAAEGAADPDDSPAEIPPSEASDAGQGETETPDARPAGEHFAEAVAMLARLPLTDAERAEAVRRLLADAPGSPGSAG